MTHCNRRSFLHSTGAVAAGVLAASSARAADDVNSRIRVAVVGLNGRGGSHLKALKQIEGVEVVAICDPDEKVLAERATSVEEAFGRKPLLGNRFA